MGTRRTDTRLQERGCRGERGRPPRGENRGGSCHRRLTHSLYAFFAFPIRQFILPHFVLFVNAFAAGQIVQKSPGSCAKGFHPLESHQRD